MFSAKQEQNYFILLRQISRFLHLSGIFFFIDTTADIHTSTILVPKKM